MLGPRAIGDVVPSFVDEGQLAAVEMRKLLFQKCADEIGVDVNLCWRFPEIQSCWMAESGIRIC